MEEQHIVPRTKDRPLRFTGELVWTGKTSLNNASSSFSGSTGRAHTVKVYRTAKGKYVVHVHHITQWQGEHDSDEAFVLASLSECVPFLSESIPGWLLEDFIDAVEPENVAEDV
ncbi:MAG: hypothetical protein ACOC58_00270 [Chloroflexota bacterium]